MTTPPFTKPFIEDSLKRVRVFFGGVFIVDTKNAKLVWDNPYYPLYYFPSTDLPDKYLKPSQKTAGDGGEVYDIVIGSRSAEGAATRFSTGDRAGLVRITFASMDKWFEEDEEIFVLPKDPYKRVDVLQSSRHIRVEVNGVEVANTHKPRLLFETGLPMRTYIPKTDCRLDLLTPTDATSQCPYKGIANYYTVKLPSGEVMKNIAWWYRVPQPECGDIKGFITFFDEFVDIWVDGEKQPRPRTPFSPPS